MPNLRLKPSIPLTLDPVEEGKWRATFLYDGGRSELQLDLDRSGFAFVQALLGEGVAADDPRLELFVARRMLLDSVSIAALEIEDETHRQSLLLCDLATDGEQLREAFARIKAAAIAIVGLGGIGSNIFDALLRMGFVRFTIVDPDKVAPSNLNRQRIYTQEDIGLWKVEAAAAYARRVNPAASVLTFRCGVGELPRGCLDAMLVVNCADRPSIQATSELLIDSHPSLVALLLGGGYFCETSFAGPLLLADERPLLAAMGETGSVTAAHQRAVGGNTFSSAVMPASIGAADLLHFVTGLGSVSLRRTMMIFDWRELRLELIPLGQEGDPYPTPSVQMDGASFARR